MPDDVQPVQEAPAAPAPVKPTSTEERLAALEEDVAKLKGDVGALLAAVAHVVSDEFKAVWAKVVNFMPFRAK